MCFVCFLGSWHTHVYNDTVHATRWYRREKCYDIWLIRILLRSILLGHKLAYITNLCSLCYRIFDMIKNGSACTTSHMVAGFNPVVHVGQDFILPLFQHWELKAVSYIHRPAVLVEWCYLNGFAAVTKISPHLYGVDRSLSSLNCSVLWSLLLPGVLFLLPCVCANNFLMFLDYLAVCFSVFWYPSMSFMLNVSISRPAVLCKPGQTTK